MSEKTFKKRVNLLVSTQTQYTESCPMYTATNPPPKLDETIPEDQLVSEEEKAMLKAWMDAEGGRKRKKPATKEAVNLDGVPVATSSLAPTSLKGKKKRQKVLAHWEPKRSPAVAPPTPAANITREYSVPSKDEEFPLPGQTIQPDTSTPDVRERAETAFGVGPSFVNLNEDVPSFEEKFKVMNDGIAHMGIAFKEYSKDFLEMLGGVQRMSQQTSEYINKEVLNKLTVKNKEVQGLLKITEEKESELRKKLKENAAIVAEAKQVISDAGNAPQLRDENLRLHKEKLKIQKELDESREALKKEKSLVHDLENALRVHLEEIEELDKHILVENDPTPRIDRIRAFGEFVETMKKIREASCQQASP